MNNFCALVLFFLLASTSAEGSRSTNITEIKRLIAQWAPLIWMSPTENYYPSSVDNFLENVYLADESGKTLFSSINDALLARFDTETLFLATKINLDYLKMKNGNTFLNGKNPKIHSVPVYVTVSVCSKHLSFHSSNLENFKNDIDILYGKTESPQYFHVSYWTFYPYNQGKNICFLGKVPAPTIFGTCFGHLKTIGSHVGDWEHVTLSFEGKPYPSQMYLSVHNTGAFYKYDLAQNNFKFNFQKIKRAVQMSKFPNTVRILAGHPVLFAANGSHGLWSAPGEHKYVKIPKLTDTCGYGTPWKSWENLIILNLGHQRLPKWMFFEGKWGNPTNNCVLSRKIGLCEHTDGPRGILGKKKEFQCLT